VIIVREVQPRNEPAPSVNRATIRHGDILRAILADEAAAANSMGYEITSESENNFSHRIGTSARSFPWPKTVILTRVFNMRNLHNYSMF
jgi:hypothetical protein